MHVKEYQKQFHDGQGLTGNQVTIWPYVNCRHKHGATRLQGWHRGKHEAITLLCKAAVQGLLEVVTIDGEFLWALLGAEDVHHLAKADHMHRHCSRTAAVDVGHVWKHQLLTLCTTCAHSLALDTTMCSLHPLGLFT